MSTAAALAAVTPRAAVPDTIAQRAVDAVTGWLGKRTSRRGFLARSAVVSSALAVDSVGFLLKPQSAYASVCGPGASCGGGWTVFCATINNGSNSCPPGSIAAGWWKATGASLCGGKSRYIIDCNATCSRCASTGRAGICSRSCWSCSCTCGPSGQCDQRRNCCNAFRYGQCNQQVKAVGGVQCRVVSCVPPWTFENCSTASATDNNTREHNAPNLPQAWTPITARYHAVGELGSVLGPTVYAERAVPGGRAQRYENGRISWSKATGARLSYGPLTARYVATGAEAGVLGFPTSDPFALPDGKGRAQYYQRGRLSYSPATGAYELTGALWSRFMELKAEVGRLGYPTSGAFTPPGSTGRVQKFTGGRLTLRPGTTKPVALFTTIAAHFASLGGEAGRLGFPLSDQVVDGATAYAAFEGGRIVHTAATGPVAVYGPLADAYVRAGAEKGLLGVPLAAQTAVRGGFVQLTRTGRLVQRPDGQACWFWGPLAARYVELGAENGALGWPRADQQTLPDGDRVVQFDGGTLTWDSATGEVTATG